MSFTPLTQLDVTHLFRVTGTRKNRAVDAGPAGIRIYTWIDEAQFEGERLRGRVDPGPSAERATVRPDGVVVSEVHLLLITDDDAEILMRYTATAVPSASGHSVKNFPIFETANPRVRLAQHGPGSVTLCRREWRGDAARCLSNQPRRQPVNSKALAPAHSHVPTSDQSI